MEDQYEYNDEKENRSDRWADRSCTRTGGSGSARAGGIENLGQTDEYQNQRPIGPQHVPDVEPGPVIGVEKQRPDDDQNDRKDQRWALMANVFWHVIGHRGPLHLFIRRDLANVSPIPEPTA